MCVRSATKGFRETRTSRCIGEGIKFHGSCWRERHRWWGRGFLCVRNRHVCTTILVMLSAILSELRSISEENTAIISNGSVRNARKAMLFNLITKRISKLVEPEDILATVEEYSQGFFNYPFSFFNSLIWKLFHLKYKKHSPTWSSTSFSRQFNIIYMGREIYMYLYIRLFYNQYILMICSLIYFLDWLYIYIWIFESGKGKEWFYFTIFFFEPIIL